MGRMRTLRPARSSCVAARAQDGGTAEMNTPRSRVLARLDAAIAAAANPVEARCLRAERAGLLARQGQIESARAAIDELNAQLAWQPSPALRGWLALAEGLLSHYSALDGRAQAGFELAYQLSQGAAALARLHALAAAWLAHMAYAGGDMPRLAALLREALDAAVPEHHAARARAALVAACAIHYASDAARAQPWYEAARRHALAEGDETYLSALMHNQAGLRADQARMALLFDAGRSDAALGDGVTHALMGAESIGHYDAGIGTASLGALVPTLRAQVLTAQGRWRDALALFDSHFDGALAQGLQRLAPCLLADRAWCEWHNGQPSKAAALAAAAEQALSQDCDTDDRAMARARLAQVHAALGHADAAQRHHQAALALYAAYCEQRQSMARLLEQALAGIDPARV